MTERKISPIEMCFMIGLTALLTVRDIIGVSYSKFILVGFVLVFAIFCSHYDLATMVCFMFPLTWGLPYTYIFLGCIVLYWAKRRKIPAPSAVLLVLFFLLEVIASMFYPSNDYTRILKYISVLAIFLTFLYDAEIDKVSCIKAFYYGSVILCAVILISTVKNAPSNWLYLFSRGWFRFGSKQAEDVEGMMLSVNANTLAYYSVVGITLSYCFIPSSKGKEKIFYIFALALFVVSGVFTVSFSWVIVMTLCTFLYVFTQTKSAKAMLFTGLGILLVVLITRIALSNTPELLTAFTTRLSKVDLATGDARTDLMLEYHNAFWDNPRFVFLGTGVTQYRQVTSNSNSFHNMIQQIFVSYGVIAGFVFFAGFLSPLRKLGRHTTTLIDWLPMIAVLLFTQTIQFINPESLMLPYVIAFYLLSVRSTEGQSDEALYNNG